MTLLMSALVAALTVGGKAIGKTFAINSSTTIVHNVGRLVHLVNHFPGIARKKKYDNREYFGTDPQS